MVVLQLNDEQVMELIHQLSDEKQMHLFQLLLQQRRGRWMELSHIGQIGVRQAAREHNLDWDAMSEDEREDFIDRVVHEDRVCA